MQPDLGNGLVLDVQPERTLARRDAIRRGGIEPHRHDRAPQVVWSARERDFLRGVPALCLVELLLSHHIEGEDEVRLGLVLLDRLAAGRNPHQRPLVETEARAQQVRFEHSLARKGRVSRELRLQFVYSSHGSPLMVAICPLSPVRARTGHLIRSARRGSDGSHTSVTSSHAKSGTAISRNRRRPVRSRSLSS
jgi:hypothetical protein